MATKKKYPKMDRLLVSNQKWEIEYIALRYSTTPAIVKQIKKQVGNSRRKVYAALRKKLWGK